jgi:cysteine desulfurase
MAIYLDYNAGAPLRPEAAAAISVWMDASEGNPSSVHRSGQRARRMLEHARAQVASLIGTNARNICFTSGGTESNNLAIFGAVTASPRRRKIISSKIEHSSILAPLTDLERRGFEILRVESDHDGRVDLVSVAASLSAETAIVTLGLANSEVGTIQDLAPLAEQARAIGALFHIDAAQAAGRIPVSVDTLGCDLITLSGHKLGAPAGTGALYIRDASRLSAVLLGGPQESGLRAGTPNLMGAIAFGAAAQAAIAGMPDESLRVSALAERLESRLQLAIPGLRRNGPCVGRVANTLNLTFPRVLGESMLIALDLEGIEVSMGSACAAGAVEASHVLRAMDLSEADARSSLRISLGHATTATEIDIAAETIAQVWRRVAEAEPIEGHAS